MVAYLASFIFAAACVLHKEKLWLLHLHLEPNNGFSTHGTPQLKHGNTR
jgi:hypothetical protein